MGALLLLIPLATLMAPFTFIYDTFSAFGEPLAEVINDWIAFFGA